MAGSYKEENDEEKSIGILDLILIIQCIMAWRHHMAPDKYTSYVTVFNISGKQSCICISD